MKIYSTKRVALPKYIVHITCEESFDYEHKVTGVTKIAAAAHRAQELPMVELARGLFSFPQVVEVRVTTWDGSGVRVVKEDV
jgi:hypothetical protein